jgi:hypothetical protein
MARSPNRDKRYYGPALHVDLRDCEFQTPLWSASQLIIKARPGGLPGNLESDQTVHAVFTFEEERHHGLFEAKVAKLDAAQGQLGLQITWVSDDGKALLAKVAKRIDPKRPETRPIMKVGFTRNTLNWSLSGFLLGDYWGDLKNGTRFHGMIWMDTPRDPGVFAAHAVRNNQDRHTLSVKFDDIPDNTFELLEAVIKKSV